MNQKICFYGRPYPWVNSFYDMIDATVKDGVKFVPCSSIFEVFDVAFADEEVIAIISNNVS